VRGSGRDVIDHPPGAGAHDDLINAAAGALVGVGCGNDAVATLIKFGEALADSPVIRTDLDPASRAALIWRARCGLASRQLSLERRPNYRTRRHAPRATDTQET
jgi:hypothetical protein